MFWCCLPELDLLFGLLIIIVYGLVSLRHKHVALRDVQLFCCCWPLLMLFGYFNLLDLESSFSTTSDVNQLFAGPLGETSQGPISYLFVGLPGGLIDALSLDIALCVLTAAILVSFKSFESLLLIMMGYIGQAFMLHSCNLVSFFVCLEMQNFSFLVLAGLTTPRSCDIDHEYWPIGSLAHGGPQGQALGTVHMKQHVLDSSSQSGFRVMAALKYMLLSAFSASPA